MLRYMVSKVAQRTNHPLLGGFLVIGLGFLLAAVAFQFAFTNYLVAGFLLLYAVVALFMGGLGYLVVFAVRIISRVNRQYGTA